MKPVLKIYSCDSCGCKFTKNDALRICSNCFACTGCEIYVCPDCGIEVVIKPMKPIRRMENEAGFKGNNLD